MQMWEKMGDTVGVTSLLSHWLACVSLHVSPCFHFSVHLHFSICLSHTTTSPYLFTGPALALGQWTIWAPLAVGWCRGLHDRPHREHHYLHPQWRDPHVRFRLRNSLPGYWDWGRWGLASRPLSGFLLPHLTLHWPLQPPTLPLLPFTVPLPLTAYAHSCPSTPSHQASCPCAAWDLARWVTWIWVRTWAPCGSLPSAVSRKASSHSPSTCSARSPPGSAKAFPSLRLCPLSTPTMRWGLTPLNTLCSAPTLILLTVLFPKFLPSFHVSPQAVYQGVTGVMGSQGYLAGCNLGKP